MKQQDLLSRIDRDAVAAAIGRAEKVTSGEIRVHVEPKLRGRDLWDTARRTFERLGMTRTEARNGVLLFIAAEEQQFTILGDRGIHEKVGDDFWNGVIRQLTERFRREEYTEGIVETVEQAGNKLREHFPWQSGDVDELSNEMSVGPSPEGSSSPNGEKPD